MTPVDVQGILERAGANPDAPEGSQAWALAQVGAVVAELIEAATACVSHGGRGVVTPGLAAARIERLRLALNRVDGLA